MVVLMPTGGRVQLHDALARVSQKSASIIASSKFQMLHGHPKVNIAVNIQNPTKKFWTMQMYTSKQGAEYPTEHAQKIQRSALKFSLQIQ
jgi:hypothetical protein